MANGIYTNSELLDSLLVDLNNVLKEQQNGQFIQACRIVAQMTQKIVNLRETIDNDLRNREETIEILKEQLRNAGQDVVDMTPQEFMDEITKKDGANDDN